MSFQIKVLLATVLLFTSPNLFAEHFSSDDPIRQLEQELTLVEQAYRDSQRPSLSPSERHYKERILQVASRRAILSLKEISARPGRDLRDTLEDVRTVDHLLERHSRFKYENDRLIKELLSAKVQDDITLVTAIRSPRTIEEVLLEIDTEISEQNNSRLLIDALVAGLDAAGNSLVGSIEDHICTVSVEQLELKKNELLSRADQLSSDSWNDRRRVVTILRNVARRVETEIRDRESGRTPAACRLHLEGRDDFHREIDMTGGVMLVSGQSISLEPKLLGFDESVCNLSASVVERTSDIDIDLSTWRGDIEIRVRNRYESGKARVRVSAEFGCDGVDRIQNNLKSEVEVVVFVFGERQNVIEHPERPIATQLNVLAEVNGRFSSYGQRSTMKPVKGSVIRIESTQVLDQFGYEMQPTPFSIEIVADSDRLQLRRESIVVVNVNKGAPKSIVRVTAHKPRSKDRPSHHDRSQTMSVDLIVDVEFGRFRGFTRQVATDIVQRLYRAILIREVEPRGLQEKVDSLVRAGSNGISSLGSIANTMANWQKTPEFNQAVRLGTADSGRRRRTPDQLLDSFYRNLLGRNVDSDGRRSYQALMNQWRSGQVAEALVESSEFREKIIGH